MLKVHFLGIGGSGASAAAAIAKSQGYQITGCDLQPRNEFTTPFKDSQLFQGHNPEHLENIDILAVTPAIFSLDPENPELAEARKRGIPIMTWQKFLGKYLAKDKFVIAIAGTHGKTTTTAMIAKILEDANLDPTVLLGAIVPWWGTNYRLGKGKAVVIEADEYNDNFLNFRPDIAVVTNIEMDHPEYFKNFAAVKKSFDQFKRQSKKIIDQPNPKLIDFPLQIPGDFNILNASLAYQVGLFLQVDPKIIQKSLKNYQGVGRRFELLGEFKGAKIYSDFGHHPTEIKVTMEAARQKFPGQRILLIYEPHMFTRTYKLFGDFVKVFKEIPIDKIIITDIYQSREADKGLVNSKQLVNATEKENTTYVSKKNLLEKLKNELGKNDVVFFMGAGDIDQLARTNFLN
ncbi:UDP-N-acetylmuramate--L-alanine ligase [Candidatus Daviesbacteria bacterium]|nr:UDP-N-acetylmuramate--L-alanine ligase [Candidatus Daviesbacteria bacterium]